MAANVDGDKLTMLEEPTSPIHPVAPYPPLEAHLEAVQTRIARRRTAGGRAPEFYGFVAWLITLLVYIAYVLWAILPDQVIQSVGIAWYPARFRPATDSRAYFLARNAESSQPNENPYLQFSDFRAIPAPYDIPPALVNRVLYGRRPRPRSPVDE
ncbi:hypothetical protein FRC17_008258 [Serendipita sp. 399]|nr:hypothetical protein FRC17_008258 [Serendipita sp. 399]